MSNIIRDGVLNEDVGHPAYKPDKDMVEELIHVVNKHRARLTIGNQFGSMLVVMRMIIWAPTPKPTFNAIRGICQMIALYIGKPPKVDESPDLTILHRRQH